MAHLSLFDDVGAVADGDKTESHGQEEDQEEARVEAVTHGAGWQRVVGQFQIQECIRLILQGDQDVAKDAQEDGQGVLGSVIVQR